MPVESRLPPTQSTLTEQARDQYLSYPELSDEELKAVLTAIYQRYKYDYREFETLSLKRRIHTFMRRNRLENISALWNTILHDDSFAAKFNTEISVGLTAFFRDAILWNYLRGDLLPSLKSKKQLSVLHAGCSTGEEVYSMALLLEELQLRQTTRTVACDINYQFLSIAKEGKYTLPAIRDFEAQATDAGISQRVLRKFVMRPTEGTISFDKDLLQHTSFEQKNIITDKINATHDIIFCRNVLIYFNKTAKLKVLNQLAKQLNPGGILILGFFDSLMSHHFPGGIHQLNLNCKVYQKAIAP